MSDHPFVRTVCDCEKCVECCKRPAPLVLADVHALRDAGISTDTTLVQSAGGMYALPVGRTGIKVLRVPTITPRTVNGKCVFLSAGRCQIHDIAPFGCAYFDVHMPRAEADLRSLYMATQQCDEEYQAERDKLPPKEEV